MSTNNASQHISVESGHGLDIDRSHTNKTSRHQNIKSKDKHSKTTYQIQPRSSQQIIISVHHLHSISIIMPSRYEYRFEDSPGLSKLELDGLIVCYC